MKKLFNIIIFAFSLVALNVYAGGGGGALTGGSTEWTQLLNNGELLDNNIKQAEQIVKQIEQIKNQYTQIANQLKNLEKLSDFKMTDPTSVLKNLSKVVEEGQAIAYSSGQIDKKYKALTQTVSEFYGKKYDADKTTDYVNEYDNWSQSNRDSIIGALQAAKINTDNMSDESAVMQTIQSQLSSSQGALQALQAAGAIANQQVEQMQKLRQLVASQIQMQGTMANIAMQDANEKKAFEIKSKKRQVDTSGAGASWSSFQVDYGK